MKLATILITFISAFSGFSQCNLTLSSSTTTSTCDNYDGSATVTPANGTSPYTYSWEHFANGVTGTTQTLSNAQAGVYVLTVTDAQGCVAMDTVQITSSDGPTVSIVSYADVSCFGGTDGTATITTNSAWGGYWQDGQTTYTHSQMTAGLWVFTSIDPNYCINHAWTLISEPEEVLAPTGNATQLFCGAGPFTLDDFTVNGSNITWYDAQTGGNILAGSTTIQPGTTYYCSQTVNGCEGEYRLAVSAEFGFNSYTSISDDGCNDYYWPLTGITYTSSGFYEATLTNMAGCDSIIELDLSIQTLDVSTSITDLTITATSTGQQYQWIDCDSNTPLSGETNQSFTATTNGNYAVIIDNGNCSDTSNCVAITSVELSEVNNSNIVKIYPNPTHDNVSIAFNSTQENVFITVRSLSGQIIQSSTNQNVSEINLDLDCASGLYFIEVQGDSNRTSTTLIRKE